MATWKLSLLLLTTLLGLCAGCPDGYFKHSSSCYFVPKQIATWPEAKVFCQSVGAELAVIGSQDEQNVLAGHLHSTASSYSTQYFWLDGSDLEEEGVWVWTSLRQKITTTHWMAGEPDNGQVDNQQHCLDMSGPDNYLWDDGHCLTRINFVCEMPDEDEHSVVG